MSEERTDPPHVDPLLEAMRSKKQEPSGPPMSVRLGIALVIALGLLWLVWKQAF
ncbi:MAG: hypothetical protein U1F29_01835 [Planctomycetota bacterium]